MKRPDPILPFRDRRGDWGRDVVLQLGRVQGGMRLRQLGEKAGLDYASIAGALRRLKERSGWDKQLARFLRQAITLLSNDKTPFFPFMQVLFERVMEQKKMDVMATMRREQELPQKKRPNEDVIVRFVY